MKRLNTRASRGALSFSARKLDHVLFPDLVHLFFVPFYPSLYFFLSVPQKTFWNFFPPALNWTNPWPWIFREKANGNFFSQIDNLAFMAIYNVALEFFPKLDGCNGKCFFPPCLFWSTERSIFGFHRTCSRLYPILKVWSVFTTYGEAWKSPFPIQTNLRSNKDRNLSVFGWRLEGWTKTSCYIRLPAKTI